MCDHPAAHLEISWNLLVPLAASVQNITEIPQCLRLPTGNSWRAKAELSLHLCLNARRAYIWDLQQTCFPQYVRY